MTFINMGDSYHMSCSQQHEETTKTSIWWRFFSIGDLFILYFLLKWNFRTASTDDIQQLFKVA